MLVFCLPLSSANSAEGGWEGRFCRGLFWGVEDDVNGTPMAFTLWRFLSCSRNRAKVEGKRKKKRRGLEDTRKRTTGL